MTTPSMKYKLPKELRHIELGKTLVNKDLFFEAFDHFKKSIESNPDCAIDILTYLYKKQLHKKTHINIELIIAKIYIEMNLFNEAFDVFEETLEENPHHETTYETLAKLITRKQLTSKIKHAFETAISNNIYFPCIINILPKIYLEEKNYTKAISLYNKLIEIEPNEYSNYKILSELHFRKRDYEAASETLHQLIKIAPFKSEELIQPIEQIIQKIPRHPVIRILYANVLFRAFKPIEGCQQISMLIKYHPNKKNDAIQLLTEQNSAFPQTPDILYLISELMIESERFTESLEYIQAIINLSHNHYDKCLLLMQKIIRYYPKHTMALEIIGNIYYQQENFLQAFHYFDQCINECENPLELGFIHQIEQIQNNIQEPSQNMAKLLMAKIYTKSNQHDQALPLIEALSQTEESIDATLLKVTILNKNHQFIEALEVIKSMLIKHPFHWNIYEMLYTTFTAHTHHKINTLDQTDSSDESLIELGSQYLAKNDLDSAIQALQQIKQDATLYETAQRMIARAFFQKSRFDLSDQILSRTIKQTNHQNTLKECHYWTGLSHLLLSNEKEALHSFETIATIDQNYLSTQSIIDRLRKNKYLNHNGLVLVGCQAFMTPSKHLQLSLRKNHFGPQKKKTHQFEVIGFAQSYNDEGCKQVIKQQLKAGRESFELAIQMDPTFHISFLNLAMIDLLENDTNSALEKISQAEAITTSCPYTFFIKGLCFIHKEDIESAIRIIQQAIKICSTDGIFFIVLGDLFYEQHQIELANTYWKKSNQSYEYLHWDQQRHRSKHFDQITTDYWISPELLSLR